MIGCDGGVKLAISDDYQKILLTFPNLSSENFEVTSLPDIGYNYSIHQQMTIRNGGGLLTITIGLKKSHITNPYQHLLKHSKF